MTWVVAPLLAWVVLLLSPWRPYSTRERLEAEPVIEDLADVTVLIPARNEAGIIANTLAALEQQGPSLEIVIVDDGSQDDTLRICREAKQRTEATTISVVRGEPLPEGWGGKLWALDQGLRLVRRQYTLLLDSDIRLAPGMVAALLRKARRENLTMTSIMALLPVENVWEKLLVPPFIFFFKLIYPFRLVSWARSSVAAAAGGCVLVETEALRQAGAFAAIRGSLIDDCALAKRVKGRGGKLWLGLSSSVESTRSHARLTDFWQMVSRTAFTQLRYSAVLLLVTTAIMLVAFLVPMAALMSTDPVQLSAGLLTYGIMAGVFLPTVRFYQLSPAWVMTLPLAAVVFLLMTWSSAISYWRGTRATWKHRVYETQA